MEVKCKECDLMAKRKFNISSTVEDEQVSAAIDIMKWSKLPSGKDKGVI
jgi:type III secretory pathway lipoprotein EscJ